MDVLLVGAETCRAADGLALSSRDGSLSATERAESAQLSRVLQRVATALRDDAHAAQPALEQQAMQVLAAARLGTTRLIDNRDV
jgi:pantoate--beta-alanine ligase